MPALQAEALPQSVGRENAALPSASTVPFVSARALSARYGRWFTHRATAIAVVVLLTFYGLAAWTASFSKGVSFDEGLQLAVGYNIWLNDDYRIEGANGDLIKRWATLPYLVSRPAFVSKTDRLWKTGDAYPLGHRFLFDLGNRAESLLRQARGMIALLGVATGLLVFWCSRELFGPGGGLLSLAVFAVSPAMLAFGGVVSTDMSITLTLFGSVWCVWRLMHEITVGRLLAGVSFVSLMVLAKPTALVMFPITAVLLVVRIASGRELIVRLGAAPRILGGRRAQLMAIGMVAAVHIFAAWAALWANHGFRYAASPDPTDASIAFFHLPTVDRVPTILTWTLDLIKRTHFLPEGFWKGIRALLQCDDGLGAFMNGHWKFGGWRWFFPYAMWVKTPPALWILLVLGAIAWRLGRGEDARSKNLNPAPRAPLLYHATPHLALIGCYLAVASSEDINIGHRHVLPVYPALYVLAGAVSMGWARRWPWLKWGVGALVLWSAVESVAIRPHYLAYFAPQVGGAAKGYQHLVDSSLDWGMNLPLLKQWLNKHNPAGREPLFLAYFGADEPKHYGIDAIRMPGFFERASLERYPLRPGYYAISASLLQGVYTAAFGRWSREYERLYRTTLQNVLRYETSAPDSPQRAELLRQRSVADWANEYDLFDNLRFARLCAWLRSRGEPPHHIGHAIFIWKLDYADLEQALIGAPVELVDEPPVVRHFRHFVVQTK